MWFNKTKKPINHYDVQPMYTEETSTADMRLYLIAHAPTYIPRWFRPEIRQKLPKDQYEQERTLQWPIYWAEQMLSRMYPEPAQTNS